MEGGDISVTLSGSDAKSMSSGVDFGDGSLANGIFSFSLDTGCSSVRGVAADSLGILDDFDDVLVVVVFVVLVVVLLAIDADEVFVITFDTIRAGLISRFFVIEFVFAG